MTLLEAKKAILTCPGDSLKEQLEHKNISLIDFAGKLAISLEEAAKILAGKMAIDANIAQKLAQIAGGSAHFWLGLERIYQQNLEEIALLEFETKFPANEMVKKGLIEGANSKKPLYTRILDFFGFARLEEWAQNYQRKSIYVDYKKDANAPIDEYALSVWLREGYLATRQTNLTAYNQSAFRQMLVTIAVKLAYEAPENYKNLLIKACAEVGVALYCADTIKKMPVYGAMYWIENHPFIYLTDKANLSYYHFWDTFFHEAGHVLLHGGSERETPNADKEKEAEDFADQMLVATQYLNELLAMPHYTPEKIRMFATQHQIKPDFLIFQLQKRGKISYTNKDFNKLKKTII
jgi:plasmid maintenance system antidote protein VapI/Zn-dependent peptidase ImmA (M78 family)